MAYGRLGARVSPGMAAMAPKIGGAVGLGKTNAKTVNAGLGGAGTGLQNPNRVNPLKAQQQDIAMAQALGLPGAKGAKPRSTGRQNQPVKVKAGGKPPMRANDPVKVAGRSKPVPVSKPVKTRVSEGDRVSNMVRGTKSKS